MIMDSSTLAATLLNAFLLFLLSLLPLLLLSTRNGKHKLPPGPYNLPLLGNLHRFGSLPHHFLHDLSRMHGPLVYLRLGSVPVVVASSADTARELLKTHDLECCSRPALTGVGKLSYGFSDIAFMPYCDQWRELRKICVLNLFSAKKVASFQPVRNEEVGRMIESISSSRGDHPINLTEELVVLANSITCRTSLGERYDGGDGGRIHRVVSEAQAMMNGFFFADYIPILGWLDAFTGARARLEKNFRDLDEIYQKVIDEHLERRMRIEESKMEDVIDTLLDMQKTADHLTLDHIKGVLMNIFIAGTDTSSTTVDWAMAELMRNPETMRKAQDEVRGLLKNKAKVEESDLEQLHYMKMVVKETMRLHPAAPLLIQRETMQDFKVHGFDIPARTRLFVNAQTIGRDPNIWERPEEFDPERFDGCSIDFRGQDFELIPFGAGRRICPGMQSAVPIVELALANLLYLFDWGLPGGVKREDIDMKESPGITVRRKSPLLLVATRCSKE